MKKTVLILSLLLLSLPSIAQSLEGSWEGKLKIQGSSLTLRFNFSPQKDGWTGTLDSPDQGAYQIPLDKVEFNENQVVTQIAQLQLSFTGKLSEQKIDGTFKQGLLTVPLLLTPTAAKELSRPQTPQPPFSYVEEEVDFPSIDPQIQLKGTLTRPKQEGKFPALILLAGSGPHDRDQSINGHKPFAVLADFYTKQGFAVLRYDKRGVGQSTGDYTQATTSDLAKDAEGAFSFLKDHPRIEKAQIGLVGHSEGGILAPMVAAKQADVKFIVLLAAPGVPGNQLLKKQNEELLSRVNLPNEVKTKHLNFSHQLIDHMTNYGKDKDTLETLNQVIDQLIQQNQLDNEYSPAQRQALKAQMSTAWLIHFIQTDPADYLKKVHCPILAINGTNDLQVDADTNLKAIERAVSNPQLLTTKKYSKLNHLFQTSDQGTIEEYAQIEETFADQVMKEVCIWIFEVIRH